MGLDSGRPRTFPGCYNGSPAAATRQGPIPKAPETVGSHRFDRRMRNRYRAQPHLGKKTSVTYEDMESLYGARWDEFQQVRQSRDLDGKFLPEDNPLLNRIFRD